MIYCLGNEQDGRNVFPSLVDVMYWHTHSDSPLCTVALQEAFVLNGFGTVQKHSGRGIRVWFPLVQGLLVVCKPRIL